MRRNAHFVACLAALLFVVGGTAAADVGDVVAVINPDPPSDQNFCSIGVAFDGTNLYFNRCSDSNMYEISPSDGSLISTFDTGVPENPNAMAFDEKRNGIWFGCQSCNVNGMPIYFWDFDDDSVTLMFEIPFGLINPATGNPFLSFCFIDGLAYNENDSASDADDELWISDDVDQDLGLFRPDGTLVQGYDMTSVDPSLSTNSGLAIGGDFLYLGNNGGGDVFRADKNTDPLVLIDQFTSGDDRQEDMECDPITFDPTEVMWVRTTPQGGAFPDVITAFEIEPQTCGAGGAPPECNLILGPGPGSGEFSAGGHTWDTYLNRVRNWWGVSMEDGPEIPLDRKLLQDMGLLGGPGAAGLPYGKRFAVQVLLWNPVVFPENPEQWSNGVEVVIERDGTIHTVSYGPPNNIDLGVEEAVNEDGVRVLRFPFVVNGL